MWRTGSATGEDRLRRPRGGATLYRVRSPKGALSGRREFENDPLSYAEESDASRIVLPKDVADGAVCVGDLIPPDFCDSGARFHPIQSVRLCTGRLVPGGEGRSLRGSRQRDRLPCRSRLLRRPVPGRISRRLPHRRARLRLELPDGRLYEHATGEGEAIAGFKLCGASR